MKKAVSLQINHFSKFTRNNVIIDRDSILDNTDEKQPMTKNKYVKVYDLSRVKSTELVTFYSLQQTPNRGR